VRGEDGWNTVHAREFGDRWPQLRAALAAPVRHVCFLNPFLDRYAQDELIREYQLTPATMPLAYQYCIPAHESEHFEVDEEDEVLVARGRSQAPFLFLDGAQVVAALSLGVQAGDRVLDMCGAPGAKAVILAARLFAGQDLHEAGGLLVCNEVSKVRMERLKSVFSGFVPKQLEAGKKVIFTTTDAQTTHSSMEHLAPFDRIIVDAPCSADRHLLRADAKDGEMLKWSSGTPRAWAAKQLKLLKNAIWLLREGGVLLYTTTALSRAENDGVIEAFLKHAKKSFRLEVLPVDSEVLSWVPGFRAEQTDWGARLLPDACAFGPLYFARIRKLSGGL